MNKSPIAPEARISLTRPTDVVVSPSGDRLASVVHDFDDDADRRRRTLVSTPIDGDRSPHRLTRVSDARSPAWSPDGTKLAFLSARDTDVALQVTDGFEAPEEPSEQVWVFDLERGGDARQVTTFPEGVADFDWGPDGDRLVVAARDPEEATSARDAEDGDPIVTERLQHKFLGADWLDEVPTYLYVVDVATHEHRRLDDAYGAGALEPGLGLAPAWSPAGDRIAFLSNRTDRPDDSLAMDVYVISPDGGDARRLTDGTVTASEPTWSPDGSKLAFLAEDPANAYVPDAVWVADPTADAVQSVSDPLDRSVSPYVRRLCWLDGTTILAAIGDEGRTRLARFFADGRPPERVAGVGDSLRTVEAFDHAAGTVGLCLSAPDEPAELHVATLAGGEFDGPPRRVTRWNESFAADEQLPGCRAVAVESDGQRVEGWLYVPSDFDPDDPRPRPAVVSIHGGPTTYDPPRFDFDATFWTSRGYCVLTINYRGSASYGRAFAEAIRGEWGPRECADVLAGVEHLVERGYADPDRVFVQGHSQGGVLAAHLLARTDRFAAAAAEHGIYDFAAVYGSCDRSRAYEAEFGLPWEQPETYREISSLSDVGEIETPLLITAGGRDWRCPPSQAEQLYVSVKKQGVPARLVVYPDAHHVLLEPDDMSHRLETLTEWFERHDPASDEVTDR